MLNKQKYVFWKEHMQNNNVKKQKYVFWKEHIQNNNVKKIEICILERTYSKQ